MRPPIAMAWIEWTRRGGPTLAGTLFIAACVACGPTNGDPAMGDDEDAASDTSADVGADEPTVAIDIVDALLVSTQGAIDRTSIVVHVEVSNLGVAPITAVQLRAFTFSGYTSTSSIVVEPADGEVLPIAPGEFAALRFGHERDGALFDCSQWIGPRDTDSRFTFAIDDAAIDAPIRADVRCRIVE